MKSKLKIKTNNVLYVIILLYFIAMSAYQLGKGFDAIFVRATFAIAFILTILLRKKIIVSNTFKWAIIFWGYYMSSFLWAKNSNDTFYYITNCIQILGIIIMIPLIANSEDKIDTIVNIIIISLIYTSILLVIRTPSYTWGTERMGEMIGLNPNALGLRLTIRKYCNII